MEAFKLNTLRNQSHEALDVFSPGVMKLGKMENSNSCVVGKDDKQAPNCAEKQRATAEERMWSQCSLQIVLCSHTTELHHKHLHQPPHCCKRKLQEEHEIHETSNRSFVAYYIKLLSSSNKQSYLTDVSCQSILM